jgi:hypothetical protein
MAINGNSDKILFQRGNSSKDALTNNTDNLGVLVIDPNKVINSENEIVDRYVKQEDLVIYASLKVYKKEESSVYFDGNESKVKEIYRNLFTSIF